MNRQILKVKLATIWIISFIVAAILPIGCREAETKNDIGKNDELIAAMKQATEFKARNRDSKGWSVEQTDWVDLSKYKDQLAPYFVGEWYNKQVDPDDVVCNLEFASVDNRKYQVDIVCRGKAPLLFVYDQKLYRRKGPYEPFKLGIFTSESLELTSIVSGLLEKRPDLVSGALERMSKSAGIKAPDR